jgi:hypothetical protein
MFFFNKVFPESFARAVMKEEKSHVEILLDNGGFYTPEV